LPFGLKPSPKKEKERSPNISVLVLSFREITYKYKMYSSLPITTSMGSFNCNGRVEVFLMEIWENLTLGFLF